MSVTSRRRQRQAPAADDPASIHPKLGREIYRGQLQEALVGKLLQDEGSSTPRPAILVGNSLVDVETGEVFESAPGNNFHLYVAAMHAAAADPRYRWVGFRAGSDCRGEDSHIPLSGSTWSVSDRIDPSYQARGKVAARRTLRNGLARAWSLLRANQLLIQRWKERFITLTLPHRDNATSMGDWATFNGAFEILRATSLWRMAVWAGYKNIEDPGIEEPHVHAHLIAIAKWLGQVSLAWEWTGAVIAQFRSEDGEDYADPRQPWMEKGWSTARIIEFEDAVTRIKKKIRKAKTKAEADYWSDELDWHQSLLAAIRHDLFIVDIRLITDRDSDSTIRREGQGGAIDETSKYVTKTTDLLKRRKDELLELVKPPRAPRVFDGFGACWGGKGDDPVGLDADLAAVQAAQAGAETDPAALVHTTAILSSEPEGTDPQTAGPEGDQVLVRGPDPPKKPPPRPRPPSWRKLAATLSLEEFVRVIRHRASRSSDFAFRRLQQAGIMAWSVAQVLEMGSCPEMV